MASASNLVSSNYGAVKLQGHAELCFEPPVNVTSQLHEINVTQLRMLSPRLPCYLQPRSDSTRAAAKREKIRITGASPTYATVAGMENAMPGHEIWPLERTTRRSCAAANDPGYALCMSFYSRRRQRNTTLQACLRIRLICHPATSRDHRYPDLDPARPHEWDGLDCRHR